MTPSRPATAAGQLLLDSTFVRLPFTEQMREKRAAFLDAILAIEAEAAAQERERIRAALGSARIAEREWLDAILDARGSGSVGDGPQPQPSGEQT